MKLEERRIIDQVLTSEEPCLGAVFCSYTFDPAYFEEHVLRAVLRLGVDPIEERERFHEEARAALQTTPVACIVDASVRTNGHRLPYDLHWVRRRTFHPKVFLLIFEQDARLAVGSGNVTKSGLEQNTELFLVRRLRYDDPFDVALLLEVDDFLRRCVDLAETKGTQLTLALDALANRLKAAPRLPENKPRDLRFVHSFTGRLLDELNASIPDNAKLTRVGVLAPFFEQDDLSVADPDQGMQALLSDLLTLRLPAKESVTLDVGAPWDDATLAAPPEAELPSLDNGLGALWAWRRREEVDDKTVEWLEYFTPTAITARQVKATNALGLACRFEREQLANEIAEGRLWRTARPQVHAPKTILQRIQETHAVTLWLHPSAALGADGRVRRRLLHAKVVLVTYSYRGRISTVALIGSANASCAAISRGVDQNGNVESCILCRFDGEVTIKDVLPTLVNYNLLSVDLIERFLPTPNKIDLACWIDDVVHDAAARTLCVTWNDQGPAPLGHWKLRYLDRDLAESTDAPEKSTVLEGFELNAACAELTLQVGGSDWQIPIRVLDLAELPTNPMLADLGLRELLALLGRRVGPERLATLRVQRGVTGLGSVLDAVFGEGFGPTDVFKAWWGAVEDLTLATTFSAFRHRLLSPTGVMKAWKHLREAPESLLSRDEVWVYGCELLKELTTLELAPGPDTPSKLALLGDVRTQLGFELEQIAPNSNDYPWLSVVSEFYGIGGTHVGA
jgi:hypothetical protein